MLSLEKSWYTLGEEILAGRNFRGNKSWRNWREFNLADDEYFVIWRELNLADVKYR